MHMKRIGNYTFAYKKPVKKWFYFRNPFRTNNPMLAVWRFVIWRHKSKR